MPQPDPQDRYRSANDLADDLRRFLDGRAAIARSPGLVRRASRTIHGHPRSALGVMAVLTLCLLIPGIFWFADGGHPSLSSRGPPEESGFENFDCNRSTPHKKFLPGVHGTCCAHHKPRITEISRPFTVQRRLLVEQLEDRKLLAVLAGDGFESAGFNGGTGWLGSELASCRRRDGPVQQWAARRSVPRPTASQQR